MIRELSPALRLFRRAALVLTGGLLLAARFEAARFKTGWLLRKSNLLIGRGACLRIGIRLRVRGLCRVGRSLLRRGIKRRGFQFGVQGCALGVGIEDVCHTN